MSNMEKQCTDCKETKDESFFTLLKWTNKNGPKYGRLNRCKKCQNQYTIRTRDMSSHKASARKYNQKHGNANKKKTKLAVYAWLNELKSAPCVDCKQSFPSCCMDFDHRDPSTKFHAISKMASKARSKKAIEDEIKKCDLVCSNCHRIRTFQRNDFGPNFKPEI